MALQLIAPAEAEPVSLAEAKAHLRLDADEEDALLTQLIVVARTLVERELGLALLTQSWSLFLDAWPDNSVVHLPIGPVQGVDAVKIYGSDGETTELPADRYEVDAITMPARVLLRSAGLALKPGRRLNGIEIGFTAGFGDGAEDVPAPMRQALILLVAHWFERREPVVLGAAPQEVPGTVASLLAPYRRARL